MRIFLGGTCNGSKWRDWVIPHLHHDFFNPVVEVWDSKAILAEEKAKKECDILLFVITPKMEGAFSIAEVVSFSHTDPFKTVLCVLEDDDGVEWSAAQHKSMEQVVKLVKENGTYTFNTLESLVRYLNH